MTDTNVLSARAINVLAFMETVAAGWYAIIEAQLSLRNDTNTETTFYRAHLSLPTETIAKL